MPKKHLLTIINGIQTIIYPLKDISAIKLELLIKAGSRYEKGSSWGAFHLLEHLTGQQTERFSSKYDFNLFQEKHGLDSNAYTGENVLGFWVKGPHYSLKQALELLNQEVFYPTFSPELFPKEISVIEQEYKDKWDNPNLRFGHALRQQLYGKNHPYTRDGIGQPQYLKTLSQKDLLKLHQKFFTAKNCYLIIAGQLDTEKTIQLAKNILQPQTSHTINLPSAPTIKPQNWLEYSPANGKNHLCTPTRTDTRSQLYRTHPNQAKELALV